MDFHRVDPQYDLERLRQFLSESDAQDYLLTDIEEWVHSGRLWAGEERGRWVAFGRLHDLGDGEGWVSGIRVTSRERGHGLGGRLIEGILADARAIGLSSVRAVIEEGNLPSRRLFERFGFRPSFELTLRRGLAEEGVSPLRPLGPADVFPDRVGWIPERTGRSDLLPGADGGRFGRWQPSLLRRWVAEGKLYGGPDLLAAVQPDWWVEPRTLWVNPLVGSTSRLFPALGQLARELDHEEWQAFLPSTEALRAEYRSQGALRHEAWGDKVYLYERLE